jgi:pyruvate/2-oxoglutarate dehydrogenase complex dihydrolipoamide acyltransferase (E2) component
MSADGGLDVRIIYDHRVMDGATVARALGRLEEILNSTLREEVSRLAG